MLNTVLQDVISAMFNEDFVKQLFNKQKVYSNAATRQVSVVSC
jgi:hypothetical protein